MSTTFLVTATPPTPNGELHVGHLSGPYLAADVFARFEKSRGNRVVFLTGSDDHQTYLRSTAARTGADPHELAAANTRTILATFEAAEIACDGFVRADGNARHIAFVRRFVQVLFERGHIVERARMALYCEACQRYLFESFVSGGCPHCGEPTVGNLCESCGRGNDPIELREPHCKLCSSAPTRRSYSGLFFPLEPFRERLVAYHEAMTAWRPHLRALCSWLTARPLPDYPVAYPGDWGIPVPIAGYEDQCLNAWFEMYPGHIVAADTYGDEHPEFAGLWSKDTALVQFLGFDNSYFNAIVHLALAFASGAELLPRQIVTNEFYLLEGKKFSTSRNHAIWGSDILASVAPDPLRIHLCRTNPEHVQSSFSVDELRATVTSYLWAGWSEAPNRLLRLIEAECDGYLPDDVRALDIQALALAQWAKGALEQTYGAARFSLRGAVQVLDEYLEGCLDYERRMIELGAVDRGTRRARIASLAMLVRALALFAAPLMPAYAAELWSALGLRGRVGDVPWQDAVGAAERGARVVGPRVWFDEVRYGVSVLAGAP